MAITEKLVLPDDVVIVPVRELPAHVRDHIEHEHEDYAVSRPNGRARTLVIDGNAAALLDHFRHPARVVDAVVAYCGPRNEDPAKVLDEVYPLVQRLHAASFLISADTAETRIGPVLEIGQIAGGYRILRCAQVLDDTDVYQAQAPDGATVAFKTMRSPTATRTARMFERERAILSAIGGWPAPRLLDSGEWDGRHFLALEWIAGTDVLSLAQETKRLNPPDLLARQIGLCHSLLEAYCALHRQGIVHGDVHPRNALTETDGRTFLIDFGISRPIPPLEGVPEPRRGGIGFFFDPAYAAAYLRSGHKDLPPATVASDIYALGSLCFLMITGGHYLDFALEQSRFFNQIVNDEPLPFQARGVSEWPEVEAVLRVALAKQEERRFSTVQEFADALRQAASSREAGKAAFVSRPDRLAAIQEEVLKAVCPGGKLFEAGIGVAPLGSVNYGAAGIAAGLRRIAMQRGDGALLATADVWASRALESTGDTAFFNEELQISSLAVGPSSLYHGPAGVHCVNGLVAAARGDVNTTQHSLNRYVEVAGTSDKILDLTLGRSGILIGAALLMEAVYDGPYVSRRELHDTINAVAASLWAEFKGPQPIRESSLPFLGVAHGWAGVLFAQMRWIEASGALPAPGIEERIEELLTLGEIAGRGLRWCRKMRAGPPRSTDYMGGWCNGPAGFVHMLNLAGRIYHQDRYLRAAEQAGWQAWEFPEAIGSLCCGLTGRSYALLDLYRSTGDRAWLERARVLGDQAADSPGSPLHSLFKGNLGLAILAADLEHPEASALPMFEGEGWPPHPIQPGPGGTAG